MEFNQNHYTELKERIASLRDLLADEITEDLKAGKRLHDNLAEFESPEDTLSVSQLLKLGTYVEYKTIVASAGLQNEPDFEFTPEDLQDN